MTKPDIKSRLQKIYNTKYFSVGLCLGLIMLIFITWAIFSQVDPMKYQTKKISINDNEIQVQVSDTPWKQKIGLSNRYSLEKNNGMLFEFDKLDEYSFVMRNMKIDLDILWISDGKVVYFEKFVPRDSKEIYKPLFKADRVVEINSGWIEKYHIGIGASYREL